MKNEVRHQTDINGLSNSKIADNTKDADEMEKVIIIIINGVNSLISMAQTTNMGTAAKILYIAKEELVHWAVSMNFHETDTDRFINSHLYNNSDIIDILRDFVKKTDAESLKRLVDTIARSVRFQLYRYEQKNSAKGQNTSSGR